MDKDKDNKTHGQGATPFAQTYFHGTKTKLTFMKMKHAFIAFIVFFWSVQFSFGQNLLLLHDKIDKKDCIVRTGKRIKITTIDKQVIKGKITEIKDSSIIIDNRATNEISFNKIRYVYVRNSNGWKTAGGAYLALSSLTMTSFVIGGLSESSKANQNGGTNDNPIPGLAVVGAIGLPALYAGTYYAFFYKKKYETQLRYNLTTIKQ